MLWSLGGCKICLLTITIGSFVQHSALALSVLNTCKYRYTSMITDIFCLTAYKVIQMRVLGCPNLVVSSILKPIVLRSSIYPNTAIQLEVLIMCGLELINNIFQNVRFAS